MRNKEEEEKEQQVTPFINGHETKNVAGASNCGRVERIV